MGQAKQRGTFEQRRASAIAITQRAAQLRALRKPHHRTGPSRRYGARLLMALAAMSFPR
jgi:hypothetical protein